MYEITLYDSLEIFFKGYEQFRQWRSDRSLCFWELVGEQQQQQQSTPQTRQSKKKRLSKATPAKESFLEGESEGEEELFELDDDEIDNPGGGRVMREVLMDLRCLSNLN